MIIASMALIACGGDKSSDVVVNTGEQSSVVETTTPILTEEEKETMSTDAASGETTTIEYVETKHDFGNVFYPSENKYTFKFKNTGKALINRKLKHPVGCTVPNKPEEPIMPGEIGEMDVIFRPKEGQVGTPVTKEITVTGQHSSRNFYTCDYG
ncbi:MAG: DUF1573 domain-containing protein [Crocinitomicaceae bacterium]|nr:DUF1573 domain-containing protein [Crocinitomicaceae bacterium]